VSAPRCSLHALYSCLEIWVELFAHQLGYSELDYEVKRLQKLHNDAVRTFDSKFVELGIDPSDAKFDIVDSSTSAGPAGLLFK